MVLLSGLKILKPIVIDEKEDRARTEDRPHVSKVQGGYPVARLGATTDIPRYREIIPPPKPSKPSTRDGSSDSSLGERSTDRTKPLQAPQVSTAKNQVINTSQSTNTIYRPTNTNPVPAQARDYRSALITEPSQVIQDNRVIIDDDFYPEKSSVLNRLGPVKPDNHESTRENTIDELVIVSDPNVSCIKTTTQVTIEEPSAKSRCSNIPSSSAMFLHQMLRMMRR